MRGARSGAPRRAPAIKVLETGVVGSLDYKIIEAGRADDLYQWLKDNKYQYGGDESTLDFYVKKKWLFTVMKIDTAQMKKNADGTFAGEVTPTRFQFASDKLVYPLKITQLSVKEKTEALAAHKKLSNSCMACHRVHKGTYGALDGQRYPGAAE